MINKPENILFIRFKVFFTVSDFNVNLNEHIQPNLYNTGIPLIYSILDYFESPLSSVSENKLFYFFLFLQNFEFLDSSSSLSFLRYLFKLYSKLK